jgi:multiple sugar transport system permease protein
MRKSLRAGDIIANSLAYIALIGFALIMIFPFVYMVTTSFKTPADTFRYPPRLLPRDPNTVEVEGVEEPLPLFFVEIDGQRKEFALEESNIRLGIYVDPNNPDEEFRVRTSETRPTGGATNQETVTFNGEEVKLYDVPVDGTRQEGDSGDDRVIPMVQTGQTTVGRFVNPQNPDEVVYQNVRLSEPVERLSWHPQNYLDVIRLRSLDRALSNTALVTLLVMIGQIVTSVLGGYAFARLKFPGRDTLFLLYLGTIMIPFVMLIVPLYQLMVAIGWVNTLTALTLPWVFTAYGTFLMRQFFITMPNEIEEAALLDGASRLQILWRIFIPASVPALATLATFTFLYAWNSFFWPLVVINTGNEANHVMTLALNVLRGRAADSPNLILAGAAMAILPPFIIFLLAQRFFVESATSSGVKG